MAILFYNQFGGLKPTEGREGGVARDLRYKPCLQERKKNVTDGKNLTTTYVPQLTSSAIQIGERDTHEPYKEGPTDTRHLMIPFVGYIILCAAIRPSCSICPPQTHV